MCLSAEVDLVAGLVVGAVGVDALRHVRCRPEWALAAVPMVLAAHQLVEVLVWRGLGDDLPASVWRPAAWIYLLIAFGILPVLVPAAVTLLEPPSHRRVLHALTAVGAAVSVVLMSAVVRGPVEASISGNRIAYEVPLWHGGAVVALYVLATCGSLLVSSHDRIRWFGMVNLVAAGFLAWVDKVGFISLWCVWAAMTSVAIAAHLRWAETTSSPTRPWWSGVDHFP